MCIRRTCQECDAVRLETSTKKRQKSEKSRKKLKSNKKKLKWRQKKNRGRKIVGYNKRSIKEDRQLTGDGIPVDACIVSWHFDLHVWGAIKSLVLRLGLTKICILMNKKCNFL